MTCVTVWRPCSGTWRGDAVRDGSWADWYTRRVARPEWPWGEWPWCTPPMRTTYTVTVPGGGYYLAQRAGVHSCTGRAP